MKKSFFTILILIVCAFASTSHAAVLFSNLGTGAPPATISTYTLAPFDQAPQAAIPNFTNVTLIPGSPIPGNLTTAASVNKRTIGSGWATWSHGYTGVVYYSNGASTIVMNLPPSTGAFYFYAEPNNFASYIISAVTDSGVSSGNITVQGNSGANGYAFYTTAGESILTITVTAAQGASGFAIGEFGISAAQAFIPSADIPTLSEWALLLFSALFGGLVWWRQRWIG